jgi:hypothetical protein
VRESDDTGNVEPGAVAEADMSDRHELRFLIDQLLEVLQRNVPIRCPGNVHYPRPTQFLGVPYLRVGRKLKVAYDDLVSLAVEIECARQRIDTGGG